ncbi:MAG: Rrf2 family transcriptional regulator [Campylobacterales bacterium]|nr:Rrf2 family transcriptional regulator [Campylobacterales bacterium]
MLITRATEYALLSLDYIRKSDSPAGAEQLSEELNIPKSFLAKILQNLAKKEILVSKKGAKGGFILQKKIKDITLFEIVTAVEGRPAMVFDCTQYIDTCPNNGAKNCTISPFLTNFQKKIDALLRSLSLEDIIGE